MGQKIGKPPSRQGVMDERWQVLRQSAETLTRMSEHVNAEESFILDYDVPKISAKIDKWLDLERSRIACANNGLAVVRPRAPAHLEKAFAKLGDEINRKMQRDYDVAYEKLSKLAELVDELTEKQRKVHTKLLDLEEVGPSEVGKFRRKLARLRAKALKNSRLSDKAMDRHKRLRAEFVKKVYDIDQGSMELCKSRVQQIIRDFQRKSAC